MAPPRGHKVWVLLSYLVLHDRLAARTRVAAMLFPEANDPLASVRWNMHELRRLLEEAAGRYEMRGLLERSFRHRERLG